MQVPSPTTFQPKSATWREDLLAIPNVNGIYSLATPGHAPHISWSINLRRRLNRLLLSSYTAGQENLSALAERFSKVSYWPVASRLETALILYELTREAYPDTYLQRLHLRMPWFIGLTDGGGFPRLDIFNRLSGSEARYGPFRTRDAAVLYEEQLWALHQIRRCTERLSPAEDHPGCIYGEMNQCLRPCQEAVSATEYFSESKRVDQFLSSAGKSALQVLRAAREGATAELDFEQAAMAHKRLEKVQAAIALRDPVVRAIQEFHGVAVTRASNADSVNLWPMIAGFWQAPICVYLPMNQMPVIQEKASLSLDATLRERLDAALRNPSSGERRVEQMALFSRWYYSSWRDGDWIEFESLPKLNYRRLVKAVSKFAKPPSQ